MADVSDAANVLVATAAAALYPNGTSQPSAAGGVPVRIYVGWPNTQQLDTDLAAGTCHVSVFSRDEERNTTRWTPTWKETSRGTVTISLTATGQVITVAGVLPTADNPQHVASFVNGTPYTYLVQAGDTLASIAAALAALIVVDVPGTVAAGATITLPPTARAGAQRVGVAGTVLRTTRQQEKLFQITVWADTPAHRDAVAGPLDAALSDIVRLTMPDLTTARLRYRGSTITDKSQKAIAYRRDLLYTVEYSTTVTATASEITAIETDIDAAAAGVPPFQRVATTFT